MSKLQTLVKQVEACRLCPLCRGRRQAVPGEGDENATVMLIGEGPGYHEDQQGRPFIGPAGQFLDELLALAGLRRGDVYITNVVKCRPPNNRDPLPLEIESCAPYLERQIAAINPKVIVTLGRFSMAKFVNETSISRIHGKAWPQDGRLVVTMYHPAAGLHNQQLKDVIREDFRRLPGYIAQAQQIEAAPPVKPARPTEDPRALLDAYALLVAANTPPEPMVAVASVPEPEVVFVVPAESREVPVAIGTEPAVAAGPLEPPVDAIAPLLILAEAEPPVAAIPLDLVPSVVAPPLAADAPPAPARRGPRRKVVAEPAPPPFVVDSEPTTVAPPDEMVLAEVEGVASESNGYAATLSEAEMPVAPALLDAEPVAAERPVPLDAEPMATEKQAPSSRKKGKPAVEVEQLSMF